MTLEALRTGSYVEPTKVRFGDYLDQWLAGASVRLRPGTVSNYGGILRRYVVPALGDLRLQSVTAGHLDRLYAELLGAGLSRTTVAHVHAVVHRSLSEAVRKGLVIRHVAQATTPPRLPRAAERTLAIWSPEQLGRFLRSVEEDRLYALWRLYAVTGCRRGEALAARWDDFDLDTGRWALRRSLIEVSGRLVEGAPKSGRARVISLDPRTVAVLRAHRSVQAQEKLRWGPAYRDEGRLFSWEDGTVLRPDWVTNRFARLCIAAGLPKIRLHDVRHSAVTAMLLAGEPVKVVSERVGHASTAFTQDVYATVIPDMQAGAAARLAAAIDG